MFVGLWLTGIELNILAMMGMTIIVGIEDAEKEMKQHRALQEACEHRTQPILLSTLAAVLTLLPLAPAIGQVSQMQQPLAIAIISGMLA